MVFGGSWGSTLSIAYAETFPTRVTELVLRGIFLLRRSEIDWYYNGGAGNIFPERWDKFLEPVPEAQRGEDLVAVYHQLLHSEDPDVAPAQPSPGRLGKDRRATCTHRRTRSNRTPRPGSPWLSPVSRTTTSSTAGSSTRTNSYAKAPHCTAFRDDRPGRYDVVCPATSAWALHKAWPESKLVIVDDAGHSAMEPGIAHHLVEATDSYR